jgi:hypothetical protein
LSIAYGVPPVGCPLINGGSFGGDERRRRGEPAETPFPPTEVAFAPSVARPLSVSVYAPLSRLCAMKSPDDHGLHRMGENADRGAVNAGRGTE